jgi:pimeloyl-ACP methyl ester carboxylesterase
VNTIPKHVFYVPFSGWVKSALADYRVLLLDQRGTGRSTPVTAQTLRHMGSPSDQAAYLECFRADSIVEDCEIIRKTLCGGEEGTKIL